MNKFNLFEFVLDGTSHPGPPPERRRVPPCAHVNTRFVFRIYEGKDKSPRYGFQCTDCGRCDLRTVIDGVLEKHNKWVGARKCQQEHGRDPNEAVPFDDDLTRKLSYKRAVDNEAAWQANRQLNQDEWWNWYNRYLESAAWRTLRAKVLERDGRTCAGCFSPAEQVHHRTYARVGYEEMDDLISVCSDCHASIHGARS